MGRSQHPHATVQEAVRSGDTETEDVRGGHVGA